MLHFSRRSAAITMTLVMVVVAGCIWRLFATTHPSRAEKRSYSFLEDGLYMGGSVEAPPPGTVAVLNMCERPDSYQCEIHLNRFIPDGPPAPSIDWLREQVDFVDKQRRAGHTTYVHCCGGASRAGMVMTAYYMSKNGWSRDEALAFVRTKRSIVKPNQAFMKLLEEWEREIKKSAAGTTRVKRFRSTCLANNDCFHSTDNHGAANRVDDFLPLAA